jgi:hypothetical protein
VSKKDERTKRLGKEGPFSAELDKKCPSFFEGSPFDDRN